MITSRTQSTQTITFSKGDTELTYEMDSSDETSIDSIDPSRDINIRPKVNVNFNMDIIPTLAAAFASICEKGGEQR